MLLTMNDIIPILSRINLQRWILWLVDNKGLVEVNMEVCYN